MKWQGRRGSSNVRKSGGKVAGGGILGIIIAGVLWLVFDMNPMTAYQTAQSVTAGDGNGSVQPISEEDADRDTQFVSVVLADTEAVWSQIFNEMGQTYKEPELILFSGSVQSACGSATSATGPFYCPGDQRVYLDTSFFAEMRNNLGITGDQQASGDAENRDKAGDFAQAYVVAHEVGHHVQTLLGISQKVNEARRQLSQTQGNELSVRQELQADCFAGVWANRNQQRVQFLEEGDIDEALHAASQIGDDRLAKASGRAAVPDNFTHGSSQQRVNWFTAGLESGDINRCDTFSGNI
ncbi:neutral zinc metallopeptidase [Psychrobacter sp. FDAARGOS_221]|uniref:KPN_02809 family neutral zinc metallopeptidase n=1 Tax=Psychrobacter sp. FDAARGOS_221 TaxID=1975705 RepID=UPI000BB57D2B|nr:neutral zinc metallopeptidase [Psychrobacter sp. FDAARGOS_221]PNK60684.1 neutral zinc metallopeptidase [Psychrobacter sp. FDAARGOS_221]